MSLPARMPSPARLRQAGAILLGKSNCRPADRAATRRTSYGRTLNPQYPARTPGGGSGRAAIVAAGGSPLGLGSDSGGGLRVPAHFWWVALKPTVRPCRTAARTITPAG